jgi:type I site-specific restriction-modification system R (restriction) subunit
MAKASGGICADVQVDEEERKTQETENSEFDENAEDYEDEYEDYSGYADEADLQELLGTYGNWSTSLGDISEMISDMSELSEEMYDTMSESMKEMLEEMGLDELSDSLEAVKGDMDPEDLKALKIKHRNKEMKDIVKADSDYLKAMFNHLEKSKGSSTIPGMSGGQTVVASSPALTVSAVNLSEVAAAPSGGSESVIDVAL